MSETALPHEVSAASAGATVPPMRLPAPPMRWRRARSLGWSLSLLIEALVILVLWELAVTRWSLVDGRFLPPPSAILGELASLIGSGALARDLLASAQSFVVGFGLSILVGVGLGLALGGSKLLDMTVGPIVWTLYSVPRVALAPIIILILGIGMTSKVAMVFLMAVFPILINTMEGARTVDRSLLAAGRVFGASRLTVARRIVLPAVLPFVLIGIRIGVVRGYIGVVLGEFLGSANGLGVLLQRAAFDFDMVRALAVGTVLVALSMASLWVVDALSRRLAPWHSDVDTTRA